MEETLGRYVKFVDCLNEWVGRGTAWLMLGAVLAAFTVVVMRKFFNTGFIWMQDVYVWQHGVAFMIGSAYTLLHGGHVRVDIFYIRGNARQRAWVNLIGTLVFLAPWLIVLAWTTFPFVALSWRIFEPSTQPGGLPGVFLLKSVILVFAGLMALQGSAMAARSVLVLRGREEFALAAED
ncbi:MAG: TRAP transporter small permease subunit [Alphaproteobacteria bacterium]